MAKLLGRLLALSCLLLLSACGGGPDGDLDAGTDSGPMCGAAEMICSGVCVDLSSDHEHCGACATACAIDEVCSTGVCVLDCPAGQEECDGSCRNLETDPANCGACGVACAPGEVCSGGVCDTTCATGTTDCGGVCRDLMTDRHHCGACGVACGAGEICVDGACTVDCPMGQVNCGGVCVDPTTDRSNCGACGVACGAGEVCIESACVPWCGVGLTECSGMCTNTDIDPSNCGSCGTVCESPANASGVCVGGTCDFVCDAGFADCDGLPETGCEAELAIDGGNCGACGNVCASDTCVAGACIPLCNTAPARVLIYGPGGTASEPYFTAGTLVTVVTDAVWRTMTTADFGEFDVIWLDGNNCGSDTTIFGTARDTQAVWGPAITGRIAVNSADPDFHASTLPGAVTFIQNHLAWVAEGGATNEGGATGIYFSWGCALFRGGPATPADFVPTFGAPLAAGTGAQSDGTITVAGATHPTLAGLTDADLAWGQFSHGEFVSIPTSALSLVVDRTGVTTSFVLDSLVCVAPAP